LGVGMTPSIKDLRCDDPTPGERVWWAPARLMREQLLHGAVPADFDQQWARGGPYFDMRRHDHYRAVIAKIVAGHADDAVCECPVCMAEAERWCDLLFAFDPYVNNVTFGVGVY